MGVLRKTGLQSHMGHLFQPGHCSNKDNKNCLQYLDFLEYFFSKVCALFTLDGLRVGAAGKVMSGLT